MKKIIVIIFIGLFYFSMTSCELNKLQEKHAPETGTNISYRSFEIDQILANITEMEQTLHRDRQEEKPLEDKITDTKIQEYLDEMNVNGSWDDVDLTDYNDMDGWQPLEQLWRMRYMALAYTMPTSSHYSSTILYNYLVTSLQYFYDMNPTCSNWWYNQIYVPRLLGLIIIITSQGQQTVPEALINSIDTRLKLLSPTPNQLTGANLTDIMLWRFYFGVIMKDSDEINAALDSTFNELSLTTAEGIQHDFSYHQHGPQPLGLSYGAALLSGVVKTAGVVKGTQYYPSEDKLNPVFGFALESFAKPRRGSFQAFNVTGRGVADLDKIKVGSPIATIFNSFSEIDSGNETEYLDIASRIVGAKTPDQNIIESHTHYYRSKHTVHNRSMFNYSLLTASTRTDRIETGNGTNLKGRFLSDGSYSIMVDGDEYYNVFPLWDWSKIPGTTVPLYTTDIDLKPTEDWGYLGSSTFTGGVSDGDNGLMVYDMNDYDTIAKKAYFFFGDEVVHLGADINSTSNYNIATTLNQANLDGYIIYSENNSVQTLSGMGKHNFKNGLDWVWHNKIGYFFLENKDVHLENETLTGNWYDINLRAENQQVSGDVYSLWIDHGNQPINEDYAYVITPGVTSSEMQNYDLSAITVLENSSEVQAVKHSGLDMLQIVFYSAKTVTYDDITISASAPATIIFSDISTDTVTCTVADPGENSSQIIIEWVSSVSPHVQATVNLPTSEAYKGKSITGTFVDYVEVIEQNKETFSNLQLDSWGSETYTGDNGVEWILTDVKGVTGYLNLTKQIYFQDRPSTIKAIESGSISGGISSFSAEVQNLWESANERKLELLVNGNIVSTFTHTGDQKVNFTVDNINIQGDFTLALRNVSSATGNNTIAIDNITWEPYSRVSQIETFNNLQLDGWGSEIYTGDNGIEWILTDVKGVTGYLNGTKHIYFQDRPSTTKAIESGIITGGISSFSAEVQNLWESANERKLEFLVNGNVIDTLIHTGENTVDFTVENINIEGEFTLALRNVSTASGNNSIAIDNLTWVSY